MAAAVRVIAKKWKPAIVWSLRSGARRFSELQEVLPGLAHKVLIQQLRELVQDGVVAREAASGGARRVQYVLPGLNTSNGDNESRQHPRDDAGVRGAGVQR